MVLGTRLPGIISVQARGVSITVYGRDAKVKLVIFGVVKMWICPGNKGYRHLRWRSRGKSPLFSIGLSNPRDVDNPVADAWGSVDNPVADAWGSDV